MTFAGPAAVRPSWVRLVVLGTLVGLLASAHATAAHAQDQGDELQPVMVDDPMRDLQWYLDRIRAADGWAITRGDPDVTIAVVDTGVDPEHRDLRNAFWRDPDSGALGYDHLRDSAQTYVDADQDWHGTAVAGVAVARGDDGYGMIGVAPEVGVMVHRIYASTSTDDAPNDTSYATAAAGIRAAGEAGADVILLTWGGTTPSADVFNAIRDVGVPVVAAAGNDGQDLSGSPSPGRYPALYRLPNLVTVAASDRDNSIMTTEHGGSNYGVRHVDIAAPGEDVVSLVAGGEHGVFDGTSLAAPQVAGALALGRAIAPGVSSNELVGAISSTARRSSALIDKVTSGGVLDVAAFLRAVERPVCTAQIPPMNFDDVPRSASHVSNIDCVSWYRVALGIGDGRFAPHRSVTRGQMASFLTRTLDAAGHELPSDPPSRFADAVGTTHEHAIDVVAELGIATGMDTERFAPDDPVTREQMATFVVRTVEVLLDREVVSSAEWFDDVDESVHRESILSAREFGITLGSAEPRDFEPERELTRAQMASFVARTLDGVGREGVTVEPRA